jgi:uncharacterized protein (TIGR02246 family)
LCPEAAARGKPEIVIALIGRADQSAGRITAIGVSGLRAAARPGMKPSQLASPPLRRQTMIVNARLRALPMLACALAAAPAFAAPPSEADIAANFARWEAALATKNPSAVAALFAPDAVLQPTVSNDVRTTPAEVEAYFVDFLKLSPKPTVNERSIRILDETTAMDAGIWTFDLVQDGKPSWVTARYSLLWEKKDGVWQIQLLHSSKMPEPLAARPAALKKQ